MEDGSIVDIQNTCKISSLISLQYKIKMLNTRSKVILRNLQRIVFAIQSKTAKHLVYLLISQYKQDDSFLTKNSVSRTFDKKRGRGNHVPLA